MSKKIVIIPAWGQKAESNWYPYIAENLKKNGNHVFVFDTPPTEVESQLNWITENLEKNDLLKDPKNLFFIAHSVGCQGTMRWLSKKNQSDKDFQIGGFLFVAPWFHIEKETDSPHRPEWAKNWIANSYDKFHCWFNETNPFDIPSFLSTVSKEKRVVLISDNDIFTIDYQKNQTNFKDIVGAEVHLVSEKHFNDKEYPIIFNLLNKLIG